MGGNEDIYIGRAISSPFNFVSRHAVLYWRTKAFKMRCRELDPTVVDAADNVYKSGRIAIQSPDILVNSSCSKRDK